MATYSNTVTGGGLISSTTALVAGTANIALTSLQTGANEFKEAYLRIRNSTGSLGTSISSNLQLLDGVVTSQVTSFAVNGASLEASASPQASAGSGASQVIQGNLLKVVIPPNTTTVRIAYTYVGGAGSTITVEGTYLTYAI